MRTTLLFLATVVLGTLLGCAESKERVADAPLSDVPPAAAVGRVTASPTMGVTEFGIGPVRAGMSLSEATKVLDGALTLPAGSDASTCGRLAWRDGPSGVSVMIEQGLVGRIDVISGSMATSMGARIGDSEDRIKSLYPGRVTVQKHKYTDGRYLIVTPALATDSAFRIVFETDSNRVVRYRAGRRPQVEYVEGCG